MQDNVRLTEQVRGLSDELHAMHAAWSDRDVKQRMQDAELKEASRLVRAWTCVLCVRVRMVVRVSRVCMCT